MCAKRKEEVSVRAEQTNLTLTNEFTEETKPLASQKGRLLLVGRVDTELVVHELAEPLPSVAHAVHAVEPLRGRQVPRGPGSVRGAGHVG